jgi:hypothetical protein
VLFGDAQRGECLAGPARHDQLAAVARLEPTADGVECLDLVRPKRVSFFRPETGWIGEVVRGPLDGHRVEVVDADPLDRDRMSLK